MKAIKFLFIFVLFFFLLKNDTFAVTISITGFPSTITDQPFALTASVSGATTGTNYLRIDIFKEGTINYFGETYNGSNWYSGGDGTLYFPISIDSSKNGSATFQGRIGTPNNNDYPGSGAYKIKIRRYTSQSSYGNDTQTPVDVTINYSFPTPSPSPTVTPAPTPTNNPTPSPTPTPTPTYVPTPTLNLTVTPSVAAQAIPSNVQPSQKQVLGQSSNSLFSIPSDPKNSDSLQLFSASDKQVISKILIFLGIVFMILCAIVIVYPKVDEYIKSKQNGQDNNNNQL